MWIGISTSTSQIQFFPHFPSLAVSASTRKSNPPSTSSTSSSSQVNLKGLGLAVFNLTTTHKSKLNDKNTAVDEDGQLSGSDVLLALQQADLRKKKIKKKSAGGVTKSRKISSLDGQIDNYDDDDDGIEETSGVKPLMIKSDWGKRIEDLERRLREISEY